MPLHDIAKKLVAPKKGILAADESTETIQKRFDSIGVESTEETRRAYRALLFTAEHIEQYLSGVILFDETIRQSTADGMPFPRVLQEKGIMPGIKVDMKTHDLAGAPGENITEGLDGLRGRLEAYKTFGAAFAKWRAVYSITDELPSDYCIHVNAHALARYAALCQEQGIVPIVEPEVLMNGNHTIKDCYDVTKKVLDRVFDELEKQRVDLKGILLKPNMVISGKDCVEQSSAQTVAEQTVACFREAVPEDVPGIVFLSGGQSEVQACENLDAINTLGPQPWELSFSYGRALQSTALKIWSGKAENASAGQEAFVYRAMLVSAARSGKYDSSMES